MGGNTITLQRSGRHHPRWVLVRAVGLASRDLRISYGVTFMVLNRCIRVVWHVRAGAEDIYLQCFGIWERNALTVFLHKSDLPVALGSINLHRRRSRLGSCSNMAQRRWDLGWPTHWR